MRLNLLQSTTELQCKCNYTPFLVFVIQAVTLTLDILAYVGGPYHYRRRLPAPKPTNNNFSEITVNEFVTNSLYPCSALTLSGWVPGMASRHLGCV